MNRLRRAWRTLGQWVGRSPEPARSFAWRWAGRNLVGGPALAVMLLLGLAITGIAADEFLQAMVFAIPYENALALWSAWIPLPLAFAAIGLTLAEEWRQGRRPPLLRPLFLAGAILGLRLWLAFHGPVAHVAFRELTDLLTALMLAIALGLTARTHPTAAWLAWIGALTVIFISRISLSDTRLIFRSDLLAVIISIPWALIAFGGLMRGRDHRARRPSLIESLTDPPRGKNDRPRVGLPFSGDLIVMHLFAIALGGALGWLCLHYARPAVGGAAISTSEAADAMELLWTRSALFGWGRTRMLRLVQAMIQPTALSLPTWMGLEGMLAAHGLLAYVFAALASFILMGLAFRRKRTRGMDLSSPAQWALIAAQALIVLMMVGGPNSSVPMLLCLGWTALGLAAPPLPPVRSHGVWARANTVLGWSAIIAMLVMGLAASLASFGPIGSSLIIGSIRADDLKNPALIERIERAGALNPWNPRVELARAAWLRERMTQTQPWSESLYVRTLQAYRSAFELDPYDASIILDMVQVQMLARRDDDVFGSVYGAMVINPTAPELVDLLYSHAANHNRPGLALEMVRRGLSLQPYSNSWWWRRYLAERKAGRGSWANMALDVALTGAIDDPGPLRARLIHTDWSRRQLIDPRRPAEPASQPQSTQ